MLRQSSVFSRTAPSCNTQLSRRSIRWPTNSSLHERPCGFASRGARTPKQGPQKRVKQSSICKVSELSAAPVETSKPTNGATFNWTKQWYPLAILDDLDPRLPHPLQLLGKDLVAWQNKEGSWTVFEDRCPHRLAPLSEGRINPEDGSLQCSYHGWRFDSAGGCVAVPQAASAEAEKIAAASSRACAKARPTKTDLGLLWVWGDNSATAYIDAAATQLPYINTPDGDLPEGTLPKIRAQLVHRDLPFDYETLVENLIDNSHAPFTHHGILGFRDKVKYGYDLQYRQDTGNPNYISYKTGAGQFINFRAPGRVDVVTPLDPEKGIWLQINVFCVPLQPGSCRLVTFSHTNGEPPKKMPWQWRPKWYDHAYNRNEVVDGDVHVAYISERNFAKEALTTGKDWQRLVYMPTSADATVTSFRKWLKTAGGGGPWGPDKYAKLPTPSTNYTHEETLDRYNQHTKNCKACSEALEGIRKLQAAANFVITVSCSAVLMTVLTQGVDALMAPQWLACGVLTGAAAAARPVLKEFENRLVFVDYVHGLK